MTPSAKLSDMTHFNSAIWLFPLTFSEWILTKFMQKCNLENYRQDVLFYENLRVELLKCLSIVQISKNI